MRQKVPKSTHVIPFLAVFRRMGGVLFFHKNAAFFTSRRINNAVPLDMQIYYGVLVIINKVASTCFWYTQDLIPMRRCNQRPRFISSSPVLQKSQNHMLLRHHRLQWSHRHWSVFKYFDFELCVHVYIYYIIHYFYRQMLKHRLLIRQIDRCALDKSKKRVYIFLICQRIVDV